MIALYRSEFTKFRAVKPIAILAIVTVLGTQPMAWTNAASGVGVPPDSDMLFSAVPIAPEYQGFEMAGFGYLLVVILAALWAGSEYGGAQQIRTTLLATPQRLRVFLVKASLLTVLVAVIGLGTVSGAVIISHVAGETGIDPWRLPPIIWARIGGVSLAWVLTALMTFAIGTLARSAIPPLILLIPMVIGLGDFLAEFWEPAKFLPTIAGAAMYSDPQTGSFLDPVTGGWVHAAWALLTLGAAAIVFIRRDQ